MNIKQTIYYISGSLFIVILMFMIVTSENGLLDMIKLKRRLNEIEAINRQVEVENIMWKRLPEPKWEWLPREKWLSCLVTMTQTKVPCLVE